MKKLALVLFILALAPLAQAQAPQKMSYQSVIRNASDELVTESTVSVQISILQGSPAGNPVFVEVHAPTTNGNGLASLEIGSGSPIIGSIEAIDWANGPFFLKSETDPSGGSNYSISGTTELLSVPYALYAGAISDGNWVVSGENLYNANNGNVGIGTITPDERLDVRSDSDSAYAGIKIGNASSGHYLRFFGGHDLDPNPFVLWKEGDPLRFATDSDGFTEKMRIDATGVRIGTQTNQGRIGVNRINNNVTATIRSIDQDIYALLVEKNDGSNLLTVTPDGRFGMNQISPNVTATIRGRSEDPTAFLIEKNNGDNIFTVMADGRFGLNEIFTNVTATIKGKDEDLYSFLVEKSDGGDAMMVSTDGRFGINKIFTNVTATIRGRSQDPTAFLVENNNGDNIFTVSADGRFGMNQLSTDVTATIRGRSEDPTAFLVEKNNGDNIFTVSADGRLGLNEIFTNVTATIKGKDEDVYSFLVEKSDGGDAMMVSTDGRFGINQIFTNVTATIRGRSQDPTALLVENNNGDNIFTVSADGRFGMNQLFSDVTATIRGRSEDPIAFLVQRSSGSNVFAVRENGKVGIGTSNPTGGVNIVSSQSGDRLDFDSYALNIDCPSNGHGINVRINDNSMSKANNFMQFVDGNDFVVGGIRGFSIDNDYAPPPITEVNDFICYVGNLVGGTFPTDPLGLALLPSQILIRLGCLDGGVIFESGFGDYAEYLEKEDVEEYMSFGDIVGVRNGKITKNTENAEQYMSVSLAPIVLGNTPPKGEEWKYKKVGFMGQVPVKIKGAVHSGDYIIPSGLNDGVGIAIAPEDLTIDQIGKVIGRSWSDSEYEGLNMVNAVIGVKSFEIVEVLKKELKRMDDLETTVKSLKEQNEAQASALQENTEVLKEIQGFLNAKAQR